MMNEKSSIHTKILYNLGFSSYNIGITLLAIEYRIKYLSQTHTELVFWSLLASVFFLTLTMVIHGQDNKTNLKIHILFAIGWISMTTQAMVILSIIYYPSMILYIMTAFIFLGYLIKYSNVEDKNNKTKSVIASKIIILLQLVIIYFIFILK